MSPSRGGRRSCRSLYLVLAVVLFFALFVWTPLPAHYDDGRDAIMKQVTGAAKDRLSTTTKPSARLNASLATTKSKYAFATFLAGDVSHQGDVNLNHDNYFVATRILTYQILHAPETRSDDIPFIVLVTSSVSEAKRERLRLDGAIVVEAEHVDKPDWIQTETSTWQDVFDKLRLWELTQFDRIAFLDGDTILARPLDGIFNDSSVASQQTLTKPDALLSDEAALPPSYVFAGQPEMLHEHHYPPSEEEHDYPNVNYLNAGFFVLEPSLSLLDYYLSLMQIPNRFLPKLPEQNLLNEAHRREGNMPWMQLSSTWNIHYPTVEDLHGGVASLHEKWWAPVDEALALFLRSWRWRMEGFYESQDAMRLAMS
jgi:alpha-N-acetylglucosamine transferase